MSHNPVTKPAKNSIKNSASKRKTPSTLAQPPQGITNKRMTRGATAALKTAAAQPPYVAVPTAVGVLPIPAAPLPKRGSVRRTPQAIASAAVIHAAATATPSTDHGKRVMELEKALALNALSKFNHTGPMRTSLVSMGAHGTSVTAGQFRDASLASPELQSGNRGRHEIASTSQRAALKGYPVATAVAAAARTSTALAALKGPNGEVVVHSGLFISGKTTTGQSTAHTPFHQLPQALAKQTDPHSAAALAAHTALQGLTRARDIRGDPTLTSSEWVGGTAGSGGIEAVDATRGNHDGYDSDTERGKMAVRFAVAEAHLKGGLTQIRTVSVAAAALVPPPSPRPNRGGMGTRNDPPAPLPNVQGLSAADAAHSLTEHLFLGYQTLK
jgi:hypothetical protein